MSRYKKRLHIALAILGLSWAVGAACLFSGVANAAYLTHISPDPISSEPDSGHVFFIRKATQAGENPISYIDAYYDAEKFGGASTTAWNNQHIEITPGGNLDADPDARVCNAYDGGMNSDEKKRFIRVEIEAEGRPTNTYYIPYGRVCMQKAGFNSTGEAASNTFFANYPMPARPAGVNNTTKMYKVSIRISYNSQVQPGTQAHPQGIRFKVISNPSTDMKIGPAGGLDYAFPIIGAWRPEVNSEYTTSIKIPFGMCFGGGDGKVVGVKDSDNFAMPNTAFEDRKVRFRVWDATDKDWQPYNNGVNGHRTANDWYQANDGLPSDSTASITINMEEGHKYEMRVIGVAPRNTIVLRLPGNTIAGDESVCTRWNMSGTVVASPHNALPGSTVTFTHTLKNTTDDKSDSVVSDILWGPNGVIRTGRPAVVPATPAQPLTKRWDGQESKTWTSTYTIPRTAAAGQEYCQQLQWSPDANNSPGLQSDYDCVTVGATGGTDYVRITPRVSAPYEQEVGGDVTFSGIVNVSNFPATTDWGYTESSVQLAAQRVTATRENGTIGSGTRYSCASGYSPSGYQSSPPNCTKQVTSTYWVGANGPGPGGGYNCSNIPGFTGSTRGTGANKECQVRSTSTQYGSYSTQYRYQCRETNSWTSWSSSSSSPCRDWYQCPGSATGSAYGSATCNGWMCQYPSAQVNSTNEPTCEARCESGKGTWAAPLSTGQYRTGGDRRCYVAPSFDLTCRWLDTGATNTITINSGGDHTCIALTKGAPVIGVPLEATLQTLEPRRWNTTPAPGYALTRYVKTWRWIVDPAIVTGSTRITGRPYMKVYGGDVLVGGGVARQATNACLPNDRALIKTYSRPDGAGSGTQLAAYSQGFIEQFVSGQFNAIGVNPAVGNLPTALTFANSPGGSGYGGAFGSTGPCIDYVTKLPAGTPTIAGDKELPDNPAGQPMNAPVQIMAGTKKVQYIVGDVFIKHNITYSAAGWTAIEQIPLYQLVVVGNIYISPDVTQLDGLYAAVQKADGSGGGNIYTCATGIRAEVTQTFTACRTQLVVNGAFSAKKVHFLRDCSSLYRAGVTEGTIYRGGRSDQLCDADNHAAEIFNYSPEQWIRGAVGPASNKYDAISSMPPVL